MSMAQKIVTLCDAHAAHDEDAAGQRWEVTVLAPGESRPTTWSIDLCHDDGKTLVDLATMLTNVGRVESGPRGARKAATAARNVANGATAHTSNGRPAGGKGSAIEVPTNAAGRYPCPVAECDHDTRTKGGITSHVRDHHHLSLGEAMGLPLPYACGIGDCPRAFTHAQGAGVHRRTVHGMASAS